MNDSKFSVSHIITVPESLIFFKGQLAHIHKKGIDFTLISSPGKKLNAFCEAEKISFEPVLMQRKISPIADLKAIFKIWKYLLKLKPPIVHSHTPKGGLLGMIAAWIARVPIRIYHMRGLPYESSVGIKKIILKISEKISCTLAHKVICVSNSLKNVAIKDRIVRESKIIVLAGGSGNGVDAQMTFNPNNYSSLNRIELLKKWNIPSESIVLGFMGRLTKDKGIFELIEAWKKIRLKSENVYLVIAGELDTEDRQVKELLNTITRDNRIRLIGNVKKTTTLFYTGIDIFVLPTYREGLPNVLLEASAMGLPIVATSATGCIDVVQHNSTGLLVPIKSVNELIEAICFYIQNEEKRKLHGANGRKYVLLNFSQEVIWELYYQTYSQLYEKYLRKNS